MAETVKWILCTSSVDGGLVSRLGRGASCMLQNGFDFALAPPPPTHTHQEAVHLTLFWYSHFVTE